MRRLLVSVATVLIVSVVGIGLLGGLVIGIISGSLQLGLVAEAGRRDEPQQSEAASASPAIQPLDKAAAMLLTGDCLGCHSDPGGGMGTKPVPALAHPLEGWTACTGCHAPDRLVATAPGHTGIHAETCTVCHTQTSPAPPMRPHTLQLTAGCLTCHGRTEPLPHSMADRSAVNCWLCHQSSPDQAPRTPHRIEPDGDCLACHTAARLGELPASHLDWSGRTCITCHEASTSSAPIAPHDLSKRVGLCTFCHERPAEPGNAPEVDETAGT